MVEEQEQRQVESIFPPDRMMPVVRPRNFSGLASTAANPARVAGTASSTEEKASIASPAAAVYSRNALGKASRCAR